MTHANLKTQSNPSLSSLADLLAPQLEAVNACILEKMDSPVELIPQIAGYLISLGGKRIRPLLTLATAELCGYKGDRHVELAACVEFIHTATLLHDDVVDESQLRRGTASANAIWNNKSSVLVGDFLFSRAFELMVADGSLDVLRILSRASSIITEGEVMQLTYSRNPTLTEETYLKIIEAKTACLFSAATEVGAVVAETAPSERNALTRFGRNIGLAFQILDDVLDYSAVQSRLGKSIGDDFREGNITLPVIFAMEGGHQKDFWLKSFQEGCRDEEALAQAISLLEETGSLEKTKKRGERYVEEALKNLEIFPASPLKEALKDVAYFALKREY